MFSSRGLRVINIIGTDAYLLILNSIYHYLFSLVNNSKNARKRCSCAMHLGNPWAVAGCGFKESRENAVDLR